MTLEDQYLVNVLREILGKRPIEFAHNDEPVGKDLGGGIPDKRKDRRNRHQGMWCDRKQRGEL